MQEAEGAGPGQELAVSDGGRRELLMGQERAEHRDHGGDVHVLVGVNAEDHVLRRLLFWPFEQNCLGHAGDGHAAP